MTERKRQLDSICDTLMYYMQELISQAENIEDIGFADLADDLRMTASNIEDIVLSARCRLIRHKRT